MSIPPAASYISGPLQPHLLYVICWPEEADVWVVLVGDPLSQQAPEYAEGEADEDLDGAVQCELQRVSVLVEGDAEEDPEAADGDHVVRGAGGDHQGGDPLGHAVPPAQWTVNNLVGSEKDKNPDGELVM